MLLQEATQDDLSDPCMLLAKSEANKSDLRFKLGAVIKYGKTKISAYNVNKTHSTFGCGRYRSLHAESYCILRVLYVYRAHGLMAKPCPDCEALIRRFRIKKVIYTNVKP